MVFGNENSAVKRVNLAANSEASCYMMRQKSKVFFQVLIQTLQSMTLYYYQVTRDFFLSVMVS